MPLRRFGTSAIVYNSPLAATTPSICATMFTDSLVHTAGQLAAGAAAQHDCPVGKAGGLERGAKPDRHRENRHQHRYDAGNADDDDRRRAEA